MKFLVTSELIFFSLVNFFYIVGLLRDVRTKASKVSSRLGLCLQVDDRMVTVKTGGIQLLVALKRFKFKNALLHDNIIPLVLDWQFLSPQSTIYNLYIHSLFTSSTHALNLL